MEAPIVVQNFNVTIHTIQATSWKLEEAIQLYFVGNEGRDVTPSVHSPPLENDLPSRDLVNDLAGQDVGDDVRPPLPVVRDVLYDSPMLFRYPTL